MSTFVRWAHSCGYSIAAARIGSHDTLYHHQSDQLSQILAMCRNRVRIDAAIIMPTSAGGVDYVALNARLEAEAAAAAGGAAAAAAETAATLLGAQP